MNEYHVYTFMKVYNMYIDYIDMFIGFYRYHVYIYMCKRCSEMSPSKVD